MTADWLCPPMQACADARRPARACPDHGAPWLHRIEVHGYLPCPVCWEEDHGGDHLQVLEVEHHRQHTSQVSQTFRVARLNWSCHEVAVHWHDTDYGGQFCYNHIGDASGESIVWRLAEAQAQT